MVTRSKLIYCDNVFSILPLRPRMTCEDMIGCHPYMYQVEPLHKTEGKPALTLIFLVSKTCLIPSQPRTSSLKKPLIRTLCFASSSAPGDGCYFSLMFHEAYPYFLYQLTNSQVSYVHEVDIYLLCSARWILFISHVLETDSCMTLLVPFDISCPRDQGSLLGVFVRPTHFLS